MKKLFLSLIFSAIFGILCTAQVRKFESAILVQNRDSISGFIDRKDELSLSKSILFKSASGTETSYSPNQIGGFVFKSDGASFESVQLNFKTPTDSIKEMRFAKILVRGAANLYKLPLTDLEHRSIILENNHHVYVLKNGADFYTLGLFELQNGGSYVLQKKYIGLLKVAFADCPTLRETSFSELKFSDKDLTNLTLQYNRCIQPNEKSETFATAVKPIIRHGAEISYSYINPHYKDYITNSNGFSAGYFWDLTKPEVSRKTSFRTGLSYAYFTYDMVTFYDLNFIVRDQQEIKPQREHLLRIPLNVQYNMAPAHKRNIPFLNFGLSGALSARNSFKNIEAVPFIDLGIGTYIDRLKVSFLLQNRKLHKPDQYLSFNLGWRLDKKSMKED